MNIESFIRQTHRFRLVMTAIRERVDEPLLLEELADIACLSPAHFIRTYHARIGEPPMATVRRVRLEWAKARLLKEASVTTVALDAGYGSVEAFSRAFSRAYLMSPSQAKLLPAGWSEPEAQIVWLPAVPVFRLAAIGNYLAMRDQIARMFARARMAGVIRREQRNGWMSFDVADILRADPDPVLHFYLQAPSLSVLLPDCRYASLPGGWYARFHVRYPANPRWSLLAQRIEPETGWHLAEGRMLKREIRGGAAAPDYEHELYFPVWQCGNHAPVILPPTL